jgi:hypothetical protein
VECDDRVVNVHGFLKKFFDVVHCNEGGGRGRDHDNWEVIACEENGSINRFIDNYVEEAYGLSGLVFLGLSGVRGTQRKTKDANGIPGTDAATGGAAPGLLASFIFLSFSAYTVRIDEKFYETINDYLRNKNN